MSANSIFEGVTEVQGACRLDVRARSLMEALTEAMAETAEMCGSWPTTMWRRYFHFVIIHTGERQTVCMAKAKICTESAAPPSR
jgi:hypothetical protein